MRLSELNLNSLTFDQIGIWPMPVKVVFVAVICALILAAGWWFDIRGLREELAKAEAKEVDLKSRFEAKQQKAVNLEAMKQQLADIEDTFGDLLRRLPSKAEVAELVVDISQQGLGAGLEFELFRPGAEKVSEFYAELPIQIQVLGTYHQFGTFISGVSDLPRIVTNHNIKIRPAKDGRLSMETTAKTYRYLGENEEAPGK